MFKSQLKIVSILALAVMLLGVGAASAYAAPYADLDYFYYVGTDNKITDTRILSNAEQYLDSIGYDCWSNQNLSAGTAWSWWKYDAILITNGHGASGRLWFNNSATAIIGEDKRDPARQNGGTAWLIKNFAGTDINDCLCAVFLNCESAVTHSTIYGNILGWARARGADAATGWRLCIGDYTSGWWGTGFARGAWDKNYAIDYPSGHHVTDVDLAMYASTYAKSAGSYDPAIESYETWGQNGQKLQPARYGTP